jgi:lactate permease
LPILVVISLMVFARWGGQRAGPVGWLTGIAVALFSGLNPQVFWVSQARGLYLSFYVSLILWPALLLYYIHLQAGGIQAISAALQRIVHDRDLLLVGLAWAFSGMLEGLAGFGLPVAIVAPILAGLGVSPVLAVGAAAIGHSWSITFGDMGIIYQTLINLVNLPDSALIPAAGLLLGLACLGCGLAAAFILGSKRLWWKVILLALLMGSVQYGLAVLGLVPLAGFGAGLIGMIGVVLWGRRQAATHIPAIAPPNRRALRSILLSYGTVTLFMVAIFMVRPINTWAKSIELALDFPATQTQSGFITTANHQAFRALLHPGVIMLAAALVTYLMLRRAALLKAGQGWSALHATWRSAAPATLGVVAMVGLSTLMEQTGMTLTLAQALSQSVGLAYPLFSPLIGMLGAFATGSNNNSNVLFAVLQQNTARLLGVDEHLLLGAQTCGGALGSMIAPAKIIVGCSTVGALDCQGNVLRRTLPYGIVIGLLIGTVVLGLTLR